MSWCGRCFTVQTTSDFESEDDGEYEYFVNSRYICKRKNPEELSNRNAKPAKASSSMSLTGVSDTSEFTSQNHRSSGSRSKVKPCCIQKELEQSLCETSDKISSIASSQLEDGRLWQVAHATVKNTHEPCVQPFFDTSTSDSDRTLEIVFDKPRREATSTSLVTGSPDRGLHVFRASSPATTATSIVPIDRSPTKAPKKKTGLIWRLFGRSEKLKTPSEYYINGMQSSLFKETMELPSPAETTKTLHWTVRVKLK